LGGRAQGHAKSKDGAVEAIRVLIIAKRSARQARVKALTQMRHLTVTAPDQLRCRLRGLTVPTLVAEGVKLRPGRSTDPITAATKASISSLAHRIQSLEREIDELDELLAPLLAVTAPDLLALFGVGIPPPPSWWLPATTLNDSIQKPPGPICAACRRCRRRLGR
jgi:hypothetical protein